MRRQGLPQVMKTLERLADEHPGRYVNDFVTDHKKRHRINYSYDDCIAGCAIRVLEPELHAQILEYEATESESFSLNESLHHNSQNSHQLQPIVDALKERFTPKALLALTFAQYRQDINGDTWPVAVTYTRVRLNSEA